MFTIIGLLLGISYLVVAITVHEFAHAYAADRLGDPTARVAGRLTLNPFAHIDLIGTIILPFSLLFMTGGAFSYGWGKPTPFDTYNLRNPRKDSAIIAIAGPISNILVAIISSIILHFLTYPASLFLKPLIITNLAIAVFNLFPIGPLDGQKILFGILPRDLAYEFQSVMTKYGNLILILMIFPFFGQEAPIAAIMNPVISFLANLLIP